MVLPSLKRSSLISLGQLCDNDCRVILDKKKLYIDKDDKLVLEGNRNRTNGLWDIPIPYYGVYKKTVKKNNNIQPPTHMAMYMEIEQPSTSKPLQNKRKNSMQQKFCNAFQDLEDFAEVNECNYEVEPQFKIERCKHNIADLTQANVTSPSISATLRKNKTKEDLINFHHAALFSPIQSTLVKAIKYGLLLI